MKKPEDTKQTLVGLILILLGTLAVTSYIFHAAPFIELIKGSYWYLIGILLIVVGLAVATFRLELSVNE